MKRLLVIGSIFHGKTRLKISDFDWAVRGYLHPTLLQELWAEVSGPWKSDRSAVSSN